MISNVALLKLNVGFIVNQSIGYSRVFSLEIPDISFSDDLIIQNLVAEIVVSRTTEGLLVQAKGQAETGLDCVYCLDSFKHCLHLDFIEMYTFPSHAVEGTELILPDDLQINLAPLIREYLYLDIPINPICRTDCQGLCSICGEKLINATCNHVDEPKDPRFSALETLLDDEPSLEL